MAAATALLASSHARPLQSAADYEAMRRLVIEVLALTGPPVYATIGNLDWWRAADNDPRSVYNARLWFAGPERLVAFAWPVDDQVDIVVHPDFPALHAAALAWAEEYFRAAPAFRAWAFTGDAARIAALTERGYRRTEKGLVTYGQATRPSPSPSHGEGDQTPSPFGRGLGRGSAAMPSPNPSHGEGDQTPSPLERGSAANPSRREGDSAPSPFGRGLGRGSAAMPSPNPSHGEGDLATPLLPPGYTIRPVRGTAESEARVAVQRAAFASEWMTIERYARVRASPTYRPELDLVIEAPGGELAGFALLWLDAANRLGVFEPLGVAAAYQRRGLGRALMLAGLRCLRDCGADYALVETGRDYEARGLYEATGFTLLDTNFAWVSPNS